MHPEGRLDVSYTDAYINRIDGPDDNLKRTMRRIEDSLRGREDEFDVVVVTGLSGVIPASIYCYNHDKQLVVIRKDDDITHGVRTEGREYFAVGTPYIILDDFISGGGTQRRIYDKLREFGHELPKYTVLYRAWVGHGDVIIYDRNSAALCIKGKRVGIEEFLFVPFITTDSLSDTPLDPSIFSNQEAQAS